MWLAFFEDLVGYSAIQASHNEDLKPLRRLRNLQKFVEQDMPVEKAISAEVSSELFSDLQDDELLHFVQVEHPFMLEQLLMTHHTTMESKKRELTKILRQHPFAGMCVVCVYAKRPHCGTRDLDL